MLAVGSLVATVADKRFAISLANYPFTVTQLSPLSGIAVYALLSRCKGFQNIARDCRWWILVTKIALCFTLHNLANNLGNRGNQVPGAVVVLISKLVVPTSLMFEFLNDRSSVKHVKWRIVGILLLLAGTALGIAPLLNQAKESGSFGNLLWRILLMIFANIPLAYGLIIWKKYSNQVESNQIILFWMSLCLVQLIIGFTLIYLNALIQGIDSFQVWPNFAQGMHCVFTGNNPKDSSSECNIAQIVWFAIDLPAGIIFNLSMAWLARHQNAGPTIVWMLRAAVLPISGVLFHSKAIMGKYATDGNYSWEFGGLILVFVGLVVYVGRDIQLYFKKEKEGYIIVESTNDQVQ
jgi:hypothetical protein